MPISEFVHLHCHSSFSFLDGASSLEALLGQAVLHRMPALALTDHNTIAGLPAFHRLAATYGIQPISGCELTLEDGTHLTVIAETPTGYTNLCTLLTIAHEGEGRRRDPRLPETALFEHGNGLIVLSGCRQGRLAQHLLHHQPDAAVAFAKRYRAAFPNAYFLELQGDAYPRQDFLNEQLTELGAYLQIPIVATSNVHHATPVDFPVYDVLACMRTQIDIRTPSAARPLNPMRYLHSTQEAIRRFARYPEAVANTARIAARCQTVLRLNESLFPAFRLPQTEQGAAAYLRRLVEEGARERYPRFDRTVRSRLEYELDIIEQLGYVDYFLVVWDIVRYARTQRIRCAGRGSAADSAVAYCLYITDVDAVGRGLLFERFMSLERAEKPDIDIDFDSHRRDEIIDYVYRVYGRDHVARVATLQTFRGRGAIREVGAALGIPGPVLDMLAKRVPWMAHADRLPQLFERVPELREFSGYRERLQWLWQLCAKIAGFPRHFGMHLGGVVISRKPLLQTTSLQPSAKGEWMTPFDKDGVEDVGLVKLDLLSLRTMAAIEGTITLRERQGQKLDYDRIPYDDKATFEMLGTGHTIGVFQLESPAQRALQSRLQPTALEDLVASVALIRPGPIQGNMVEPFLDRRRGNAPITYLHPLLEPILGKTYGVVLFQEQVIEIATAIAKFTPGEADRLRRVMSHARSHSEMEDIGQRFMEKAAEAGVQAEVAQTIFSYIQSYASYGFCEAHAAAFAATAYKTAYLVQHHPAEFFASILNQYPMGYYPVHVVCAEARRRGIRIDGIDIAQSEWHCTAENGAIRLGFCLVKGFREPVAKAIERARQAHSFTSVLDCLRRVPELDRLQAERLIRVGAFDALHPERRELLWRLPDWTLERQQPEMAFLSADDVLGGEVPGDAAPESSLAACLADEYNLLGVGVSGHWLNLFRSVLSQSGFQTAADLEHLPDGTDVCTAGLVIRPHRPPTKSGRTVVFFALEDETGMVDATMFESVYHAEGAVLFTPHGRIVGIRGRLERRGGTQVQVIVSHIWSLTKRDKVLQD